jgi:hypothetical protein
MAGAGKGAQILLILEQVSMNRVMFGRWGKGARM